MERWQSLLTQSEPEVAQPEPEVAAGGFPTCTWLTNTPLVTTAWTTANTNFYNSYPTSITTTTTNVWVNLPVVPYQWAPPTAVQWLDYGTGGYHAPAVAADYEARRRRDAILREKARKRGRRLLMGILNDQQLIEYAKTRGFTVVGDKGGLFRIQKVGRVQELDLHRHVIALHCIHLSFAYIEEDNLVALKMLIETDEMEFRHIANTQHTHPLPLQEAA